MAKGRATVRARSFLLPPTKAVREVFIVDSSVPAQASPVFAFRADTQTFLNIGGEAEPTFNMTRAVSVTFPWMAASDTNTSHNVRWNTYLLKIVGDAAHTDLDSLDIFTDYVKDEVTSTLTASGSRVTNAEILIDTLDHGLTPGDLFSLVITRDVAHPDDTLTGDAYLFAGFFSVNEAM